MTPIFQKLEKHPLATSIAVFVFVLLVAATGWRTYHQYSQPSREFDWSNRGLSDFHNGTYYPSLAFREGVVPYGQEAEEKYLLARAAPPYHPVLFMLHAPFTFVDVKIADGLFFLYNLGLVLLLAFAAIKLSGGQFSWFAFFLLGSIILLSRPGHVTLFTGYFTLELVLGTVLAIAYAEKKPWISGCGLLLAAGKPTFVLPLMILMACRRNWASLIWGVGLSVAVGLAGLFWMASFSDLSTVVDGIVQGQQALQDDETEFPINTWTRTDLVGMVAKVFDLRPGEKSYLAWMLALLVVPGFWLWRRSQQESPPGEDSTNQSLFDPSGLVIVLVMLLSIYHHSYDCLLMFVPWAGLVFYGSFNEVVSDRARFWIGLLISIVWLNYASTQSVRGILRLEPLGIGWQAITMVNGLCILITLILILTDIKSIARVKE